MRFVTAMALLATSLFPIEAAATGAYSQGEVANLQKQMGRCIKLIKRNTPKPVPAGQLLVTFELASDGRVRHVRVIAGGNLMNRDLMSVITKGIYKCPPFKSSFSGRVSFPLSVK